MCLISATREHKNRINGERFCRWRARLMFSGLSAPSQRQSLNQKPAPPPMPQSDFGVSGGFGSDFFSGV